MLLPKPHFWPTRGKSAKNPKKHIFTSWAKYTSRERERERERVGKLPKLKCVTEKA